MNEILKKIGDGIRELFPDAGDLAVGMETRLEDIPDYDSLSAVNLQNYLEESLHVAVPLDLLNGETTIGEVVSYIRDRPSSKVPAE